MRTLPCHELLSQQATLKPCKLVKKHATQLDDYIERFIGRVKTYFKSTAELGDPNNSQRYVVLSSMDYASVNAIIPGCSQVFLMTVSTSHPVNAKGIISVMDSCHSPSLKLVFVVPSDLFPKFLTKGTLRTDRLNSTHCVLIFHLCRRESS